MINRAKSSITPLVVGFVLASCLGLQAQVPTTPASAQAGTTETSAKRSADDQRNSEDGVRENPLPMSRLALLPPQPPQVTYENGMLSIRASNCTLEQVLHVLEAKTGASVDYPRAAASERIAAELGPGRPSEVLAELFDGSRFNYIILGAPGDPGRVQRLILTEQQTTQAGTISVPPRTEVPVKKTVAQQHDLNNPQLQERKRFWMQIAQQHARQMADPANQNAGPPPPPPME